MKNRASGTAEGIAYMRSYEAGRPEEQRICNDYMAYDLSAWWVKMASWMCRPFSMDMMDRAFERKGKGVSGFIAVRTRLFDDYVLQNIEAGAKQVVILGAGLDSRAYRFSDQLRDGGVRVFEIDHPLSQSAKKERVLRLLGKMPEGVSYVPVDFNQDDLWTSLKRAGYDEGLKTIFTFEGVTMYLNEDAVKATLNFVIEHAGEGSSILFDYVFQAALDGRIKNKVITHMNNLKFFFHEPVTFGIERGAAVAFVTNVGFHSAIDYPPEALYDLYFKEKVPNRTISDVYGIVAAYK